MKLEEYISLVMPKMGGWCTSAKAQKIAEVVSDVTCFTYVEVGVFAGRSLFAAALAMPKGAIAIGIDPWKQSSSIEGFTDVNREWWGKLDHEQIYLECVAMQQRLSLEDKVFLIRSTSQQAIPLVRRLAPIDCVYVDGNHSEYIATFDAINYSGLVKPGGYVFFDDMDWTVKWGDNLVPSTKRAQDYLSTCCEFVCQVENLGVYRKKPEVKCLATTPEKSLTVA